MTPERKTELLALSWTPAEEQEVLDALDKAESERDALQAQVVRLQTGQEIESDYIDELAVATQCVADLMRENDELEARLAESERTLQKRVAELEDRLACELAVNVHYPDVLKERNKLKKDADVLSDELHRVEQLGLGDANRADRYLAALKAEACNKAYPDVDDLPDTVIIGGITFLITRNANGTTEAEEV